MSYGEGNLRERVAELEAQLANRDAKLAEKVEQFHDLNARIAELEELLDSSHQTIHAMQGKLVEREAEKERMLMLVGKLHDLLLRKVVSSSALREFCDMFIAEFGDAEGGE